MRIGEIERNRILEFSNRALRRLGLGSSRLAAGLKARARPVEVEGVVLPPAWIRLGGRASEDDASFLVSAVDQAERVRRELDLDPDSRILDVGCGVGRLPIGLAASQQGEWPRTYTGVDVDRGSIIWCRRNLARWGMQFELSTVRNDRYNPRGARLDGDPRLPFADDAFDAVCLFSVFSHMTAEDVRAYLAEIATLLAPAGRAFLTAFVEEGVPDEAINPADYGAVPGGWSGALHCVRFERGYLLGIIAAAGLRVEAFRHDDFHDGQSTLIVAAG